MSTTDDEEHCVRCEDDSVDRCVGCSQDFCPNHYFEHREELSKQLEVIENNRNTLQHMFNEYNFDEEENVLMKSIDRWEEDSFRNIREKASILRQNVGRFKNECIYQMKFNLSKLTDQLRKIRRTSVFHESHLQKLNEELEKLKEKLYDLSRVIVQEHSGPLINKISMTLSYVFALGSVYPEAASTAEKTAL
ncbi:hypothetical protein I4U23_011701 [Adineta vaga]|nr:hypothetical protein I4U23_011701 [Adineta vaga]